MENVVRRKITLGVAIGSRAFFSPAPCKAARDEILHELAALGVDAVILPYEATENGAVQSIPDADLYAEHFRKHADRIDGIVVCLPNFGDEIAVAEMLNRARLGVPVLLQAANDDNDKVSVSQRRDAWCGKISVTNNLYQYGIPFTEPSTHTSDIASDAFRADLARFVGVCRVVRGLTGARLGAIGARTAPFQTMRYSEKLLQQAGVTVVTVDLSEMIGRAAKVTDADIAPTIERIRNYGRIPAHIRPEQVATQARWTVAVNRWIEENGCDASAIQCWRSLQDNFGCATCVTMSMMGEELMPSACEVDIMGALSMYALALASKAPPAILDWNNNFAREADKVVATHCGNFPKSFIGDTPEIGELDVLGEVIGRSKCFGAVKGKVKAGPMTYFRVSSDDAQGHLKAYLGEGEFTDDPYGMDGGIAVCRVPELRRLMGFVTQNGFEHHVAMVRGHHAPVLHEALTRYLGWPFYDHDTPPAPQLYHPRSSR
jgi:L-fucose isomerase-like protein